MSDDPARVSIFGCFIDVLDLEQTVERCSSLIDSGGPARQVSLNVFKVAEMRDDHRLLRIVQNSDVVSADGQPIVWAARLLRKRLPGRVAGIDLMARLVARAEERGWRIYLLGARERVLNDAAERLLEDHPKLRIVGRHHGYLPDGEENAVVEHIREVSPHLLFVAMASPKKEYWMAANQERLGVPLLMGVGGAFDVVAGKTRRASPWVQRMGLEWAFRISQEPRRLFMRYLRAAHVFSRILWHEVRIQRARTKCGTDRC